MGGFTEPVTPPEAPEEPPENAFDIQSFLEQAIKIGRDMGALKPAVGAGGVVSHVDEWSWLAQVVKAFIPLLIGLEKAGITWIEPLLKAVLEVTQQMLDPGLKLLGDLTSSYVGHLAGEMKDIQPGKAGTTPSGMKPYAAGMFDGIMKPLGFLGGGRNPQNEGAGAENAEFALGSLITIHLTTWMVDILANFTGIGMLKYIHSFDNAITSAISARGIGRIASRPYLMKYMSEPLTRDLNAALPLDDASPSTLVKSYLRGAIDAQDLKLKMRQKGYKEEITENLLLDTAKLYDVSDLQWLIDQGQYTVQQAVDSLTQQGYPANVALVKILKGKADRPDAQYSSLANSLVTARADHKIDNETLRYMLSNLGFDEEQVESMAIRGATLAELPNRLTLTQVKQLYQEGLVDLDYVQTFLAEEGYGEQDQDLLVLLEFTKKEERTARANALAEARRVAADKAAAAAAAAEAKRQAELEKLAAA